MGPTGEGEFQPAAIRRLREIGAWMAANGEAIHGTRPTPYPEPGWGRLTQKCTADGRLRLHALVYDPKPGAVITIAGPATLPEHAWILETGEKLSMEKSQGGGLNLTLPDGLPDDNILAIGME